MLRTFRRRADLRLVALATLIPYPVHAAGAESSGTLSLVLRAVGSLGAVLVLIGLLALLFKHLRTSRVLPMAHRDLKAVGRLGLGGRREVRLVQVRDRLLVLGVTEQHIEMLTELPADGSDLASEPVADAADPVPDLRVLQKLTSSP
ncbi:MAG: hypothetical protein DHS20C21_08090 [Gemmatimonadota bacterium]|nr:MAG: hypothetical protein DHS20C21_08090 [Gemmatimonadota bacterium]